DQERQGPLRLLHPAAGQPLGQERGWHEELRTVAPRQLHAQRVHQRGAAAHLVLALCGERVQLHAAQPAAQHRFHRLPALGPVVPLEDVLEARGLETAVLVAALSAGRAALVEGEAQRNRAVVLRGWLLRRADALRLLAWL